MKEAITQFNIHGAMVDVDKQAGITGYEDVFTELGLCRRHHRDEGLSEDYIPQFVR